MSSNEVLAPQARRSLKFCEMQMHSSTAPVDSVKR
jgi:hypothetical protein